MRALNNDQICVQKIKGEEELLFLWEAGHGGRNRAPWIPWNTKSLEKALPLSRGYSKTGKSTFLSSSNTGSNFPLSWTLLIYLGSRAN